MYVQRTNVYMCVFHANNIMSFDFLLIHSGATLPLIHHG